MKPISALTWILTPSGVLVTLMHDQHEIPYDMERLTEDG